MATLTQYVLHFGQPWWLLAALLAVPAVALSWRNLEPLGRPRQVLAAIFRTLVFLLLAAVMARPEVADRSQQLTLIAVVDRSQSIPTERSGDGGEAHSLLDKARGYFQAAAQGRKNADQLAVVDVAEFASISQLPSTNMEIAQRNTSLLGMESKISSGIEMGLAIAPPNTSVRMLLVSDGNETAGDLKEAARIAAANSIPIDVLPIHYEYKQEVVFQNLVAPVKGRSGQTIPLRFVLHSTGTARGQLLLSLNGKTMHLGSGADQDGMDVELHPGTNVRTLEVPLGAKGMHEFRADFLPAEPSQDSLEPNNHASAITFVAGPGFVTIVSEDDKDGDGLATALKAAQIDVRRAKPTSFTTRLAELADCDAVVLANTQCGDFSYEQQEMLVRYVNEMGGGLVMTGGPLSFGAGGWIGSPVEKILPVDLDPPHKKQMPKGALVLILHACEMPDGNGWSKKVAEAAINTLSRLDMAGILEYGFGGGANAGPNGTNWVYPLSEVGDKTKVMAALKNMQLGDMPDFGAPMQEAYDKLKKVSAGQKHVIIISDGDPAGPSDKLLKDYVDSGITCTGITVFPHSQQTMDNLKRIAAVTGGHYYNVDDPKKLPQIFIKEAQIVRRSLIQEEKFTPERTYHEIVNGITALPQLEGYVLTGPRGWPNQLVLTANLKNEKGESSIDPILATGQQGLGRTVAFTSSADSRWAPSWMRWGGFNRFWEQVVRYASKSSQAGDLEVFADVQGRQVTVTVESVDSKGQFVQFSQLGGQVIAPDMSLKELPLTQVGPGRYRANFQADAGGCYLLVLQYKLPGSDKKAMMHSAVVVPYAPEFRDLTDNAALLAEVAHITGGRVIKGPPEKADLFSRAGVRVPQSATPLTGLLMMIWLGVFLADVAIRRIAIDFAAIGRRIVSVPAGLRRKKVVDATLDRLKGKRQEFLDQLAKKKGEAASGTPPPSPQATATRRYEAKAGAATEIDAIAMEEHPQAEKSPLEGGTPPKVEPPKPADKGHLQQLLDAKKRAKDKLR